MEPRLPDEGPLTGPNLELRRLTEQDLPELAEIVTDPEVYAHGYVMHHRPTDPGEALELVRRQWLSDPTDRDGRGAGRMSYAIRLRADGPLGRAGELVGTSSLGEVHLPREQAHLGWTLYAPRFWGSGTNAEAKWLLLRHCFEQCGLGRVKIQTDILNTRSQAAIARLGATREGVLRREQPREDGSWRDTVVFSILADEWPQVSQGLRARFGG
ncbi:GNAT family protein [Luteococcus peritonei]|uniref:GNAT family protein n=1 Tax=Luteococcus peritonei TaxID=88874 RepID=A0ABW4RUR9_9ACTN